MYNEDVLVRQVNATTLTHTTSSIVPPNILVSACKVSQIVVAHTHICRNDRLQMRLQEFE
jgi:hypothetical protein